MVATQIVEQMFQGSKPWTSKKIDLRYAGEADGLPSKNLMSRWLQHPSRTPKEIAMFARWTGWTVGNALTYPHSEKSKSL